MEASAEADLSGRSFLSRRSGAKEDNEGRCSMKITEDVRKYAAEQELAEDQALESGLQEKAKEFLEKGAEVYAKI
jgi:hypothetical protein